MNVILPVRLLKLALSLQENLDSRNKIFKIRGTELYRIGGYYEITPSESHIKIKTNYEKLPAE